MFAGTLKTSLLVADRSNHQSSENARSPIVDRSVSGTANAEVDDKRKRCRPGSPVTGCRASNRQYRQTDRHLGPAHVHVRSKKLNYSKLKQVLSQYA